MILRVISYQLSWLHRYITIQYDIEGGFSPIVLATSLLPLTSRAPMTFRQGDGGRVCWRDITHLMMLSDLPEHNLSIICTGIKGKKKELGNFKTMQKVRIFPKYIGMVYGMVLS